MGFIWEDMIDTWPFVSCFSALVFLLDERVGPRHYDLIVLMTDNGSPPLTTQIVLNVSIQDMNDP